MKIFKKLTVIAAAVTMLFAISACANGSSSSDSDDKKNPETPAVETPEEETPEEEKPEEVKTVAVYDESSGMINITLTFYSDKNWEVYTDYETKKGKPSKGILEAGTYTGSPEKDGDISLTVTKVMSKNGGTEDLPADNQKAIKVTVISGLMEMGELSGQTLYFIRRAEEIAVFNFIYKGNEYSQAYIEDYKFYTDNTFRAIRNGEISIIGYYEEDDDPGKDGPITLHGTYMFNDSSKEFKPIPSSGSIVDASIDNDILTSRLGEHARQIAVYAAEYEEEGVPVTDKYYFYADGAFLETFSTNGMEVPGWYGTYTISIPSGDTEEEIGLTFSYFYDSDKKFFDWNGRG